MTSVILCGHISSVPAKDWGASTSAALDAVERGGTSVPGLADCSNLPSPKWVGEYRYG